MFDSVYYDTQIPNLFDQILKTINQDFADQLRFFKQIEKSIEKIESVTIDSLTKEYFKSYESKMKHINEKDLLLELKKFQQTTLLKKPIKKQKNGKFYETNENFLNENDNDDDSSLVNDEIVDFIGKDLINGELNNENLKIEEEEIDLA